MCEATACPRVREFAGDFIIGLGIAMLVLLLSVANTGQARAAMPVATDSGAIVVPGSMARPSIVPDFPKYVAQDRIVTDHEAEAKSALPSVQTDRVALLGTPYDLGHQLLGGNNQPSASQERNWMLAIMVAVFASMTALTFSLWRNLSRAVAPRRRRRLN